MVTATISSKYQVVIPRSIREEYNFRPGQKIMFIPYEKSIRIVIVPSIEDAHGIFEGMDTDPQREKEDRSL